MISDCKVRHWYFFAVILIHDPSFFYLLQVKDRIIPTAPDNWERAVTSIREPCINSTFSIVLVTVSTRFISDQPRMMMNLPNAMSG